MEELNELRTAARNRLLLCVVGVVALGLAAWGITHSVFGFLAVLPVGGFLSLFTVCPSLERYRSAYKKRFVRKALQAHFSELRYAPNRGIPEKTIANLHMMNMGTSFWSEDYYQGTYKGVRLEQAYVVIKKQGNRSSMTLFHGRWIIVDFNKPLRSGIQIVQNGFLAAVPSGFSRVELESEAFNRDFFVLAQNAHDAFYVLTPAFMERIQALAGARRRLMLCFAGNRLHIAIDDGKDAFEPGSVFRKLPTRTDTLAWVIDNEIREIIRLIDTLCLDNDLFLQEGYAKENNIPYERQ